MARLQQKKQAAVTTGTPNNRHSLRDGLRLMACSPRGAGLDSPRRVAKRLATLDLSVGRPGPHAFARPLAASLVQRRRPRPSHSAPRFVTIGRNVPLDEAGWPQQIMIFCFSAIDLFLHPGLESPEDIGAVLKFGFFARANCVSRSGL
jgi:hypothetical protein